MAPGAGSALPRCQRRDRTGDHTDQRVGYSNAGERHVPDVLHQELVAQGVANSDITAAILIGVTGERLGQIDFRLGRDQHRVIVGVRHVISAIAGIATRALGDNGCGVVDRTGIHIGLGDRIGADTCHRSTDCERRSGRRHTRKGAHTGQRVRNDNQIEGDVAVVGSHKPVGQGVPG